MQIFHLNPKLLKAAVYGANDGIITTFAVVAGVAGADLSANIVIILGIANMIADGVSMGIGDYLGERSEQRLRSHQTGNDEEKDLWHTGAVTFVSFVLAGTFPLLPYFLTLINIEVPAVHRFALSIFATAAILFLVGSIRTVFIKGSWVRNGLEMLGIGAIAAVVAYGLGLAISLWCGDVCRA